MLSTTALVSRDTSPDAGTGRVGGVRMSSLRLGLPLAKWFAPLDAAHVRQLARALGQGRTRVAVLLRRLAGAGLALMATRRVIADRRRLHQPQSRATTPSAATTSSEVAAALTAAATSYRLHPDDNEQAAHAIVARVGWSLARARWFLSVNQDRVRQTVDRLAAEHPPET